MRILCETFNNSGRRHTWLFCCILCQLELLQVICYPRISQSSDSFSACRKWTIIGMINGLELCRCIHSTYFLVIESHVWDVWNTWLTRKVGNHNMSESIIAMLTAPRTAASHRIIEKSWVNNWAIYDETGRLGTRKWE